jgi:hypothetical protein
MSSNVRDLRSGVSEHEDRTADPGADGLSTDELRAEQAGELPEREAMSILDVGSIGVGLPTPTDIADQLGSLVPPGVGPVDGPIDPVEMAGQLPVDITGQLPDGTIPVGDLPADPTDGGDLIGIPETPALDDSSRTLA